MDGASCSHTSTHNPPKVLMTPHPPIVDQSPISTGLSELNPHSGHISALTSQRKMPAHRCWVCCMYSEMCHKLKHIHAHARRYSRQYQHYFGHQCSLKEIRFSHSLCCRLFKKCFNILGNTYLDQQFSNALKSVHFNTTL